MAQGKPAAKKTWLGSLTGRLTRITAVLVACVALLNGAIDLGKIVAHIPIGDRERLNSELFRINFGKKPIVEQPLEVATSNMKVPLLLQVFPSGDLFVRYGNFEQWLPFTSVKVASVSILPEAYAQSPFPSQAAVAASPNTQGQRPIYIDLDKLRAEALKVSAALPNADSIEKTYVLAEMKDDHPYFFERSIKEYSKKFVAEPGYRFASFDFLVSSSNHYTPGKIEIVDNGRAIVATFKLKSGAALDRYRGWVQGTLRTQQLRSQ
ncbi:hypothetical protein [Massilia horti]|uniref:Uncharacterized protein n=1 Tax=Massilia horti TaxID=2562153 RepID=A0A4Y9T8N0_9BURK|nr:hypothetical protein [Massilia horti]TFW35558.1 hypothetical protein E4O92_01835 [Massilia horti]